MKKIGTQLIVVIGILAAIIIFLIASYRNISKKETPLNDKVEASWNELDEKFELRESLLSALEKSVKPHLKVKDIKEARLEIEELAGDSLDIEKYYKAQEELSKELSDLLHKAEEIDELKEDEAYLETREKIRIVSLEIEEAINAYNATVDEYNEFTLEGLVFFLKHPEGLPYFDGDKDKYKDMVEERYEYLGIELIDFKDFWELFIRFSFNLLVILIAVRWLYYPIAKRKDYLFTYILIGSVVFLLCFLLENVKLELGFALGLFAIFGIIRYRTDAIPIKEMTYLFLVIGIAVINALANKKVSYFELVFTNIAILAIAFFLEHVFLLKHESTKTVLYEKIDLIQAGRREELLKDLAERTGLIINRVEIGRINFLRDTVRIKIYYFESDQEAIFHQDDYGKSDGDDGF